MAEVIVTAKTVEEAVVAGCEQLGVSRDDLNLEYEVLEMPLAADIFKLRFKAQPAKVKVSIPDAPVPAAKPEKSARPAEPRAAKAEKPAEKAKPVNAEKPAAKKEKAEAPAPAAEPEVPETPVEIDSDVRLKAAAEYLTKVVELMGVEGAKFTAGCKDDSYVIHVSGEGLSVLIGRRGETMKSLSYLASLVANRQGGDYIKLGLDVAGYRDKREKDLQELARRTGRRVQRTGRSAALEPMNPYERRIIHSTIGTMEGLRSESKGEGADRRVVIYSTDENARSSEPHENRAPRGDRNGRKGGRGGDRGGRRSGGRRYDDRRSSVPGREFADTPRDPEAKPYAPARTERINDAEEFALFGKIDL